MLTAPRVGRPGGSLVQTPSAQRISPYVLVVPRRTPSEPSTTVQTDPGDSMTARNRSPSNRRITPGLTSQTPPCRAGAREDDAKAGPSPDAPAPGGLARSPRPATSIAPVVVATASQKHGHTPRVVKANDACVSGSTCSP